MNMLEWYGYFTRTSAWAGIVLFIISIEAHIKTGQDCYRDFGGRKFQRIDASIYTCWPGGKYLFKCYPGSAIPVWYDAGYSNPCLCIQVYSKSKGKRAHICPSAPKHNRSEPGGQGALAEGQNDLGRNDLEGYGKQSSGATPNSLSHLRLAYQSTTLSTDTTADTTKCPDAFHEVKGFKRLDIEDSFSLALGPEGAIHGHFITKDVQQCQELCLSMNHCRAMQFSPLNHLSVQNARGFCKGFANFGDKENLEPAMDSVYFIRRGCYNGPPYTEIPPATTAVVSFATGPLFQYMYQPGGELVSSLGGGEEQCRQYCHDNRQCVAVDYNIHTHECWWHSTTSCSTHVPAPNFCCNHYKKNIKYCH